jgi:hypothetical protein
MCTHIRKRWTTWLVDKSTLNLSMVLLGVWNKAFERNLTRPANSPSLWWKHCCFSTVILPKASTSSANRFWYFLRSASAHAALLKFRDDCAPIISNRIISRSVGWRYSGSSTCIRMIDDSWCRLHPRLLVTGGGGVTRMPTWQL